MATSTLPVGFAILGAGMIAHYHAMAITQTPGARLIAFGHPDPARGAAIAAKFGVPCMPNLDELLALPDMEALCICTPSGLHAAQAIQAAKAGKHVLVEKPLALTLADADAMIATCAEAGVRLGVALQRRTDPVFRAVRAAITAGAVGRPVLGTVAIPYLRGQDYYDSAGWRGTWALDGGGVLMNQGIHIVDLLLWYLGEIDTVQAHSATLAHDIEVEDVIVATLRFTSGALGSIAATTAAAPGFAHQLAIYGDRGSIQIAGEHIVRWEVDAPPPEPITSGVLDAGSGSRPGGIDVAGHARLIADMVESIRGERAPLVTGSEGRRSLAAVLAIYDAAGGPRGNG